jgi:hypothetical protein
MRRHQLSLEQYDSDKIGNNYLEIYDSILQPWVDEDITLLELGVYRGGSLLLWRDYFPKGKIIGIDIKLSKKFTPPDRVRVFEGSQTDQKFLSCVAKEVAPDGFDIIIDDASHIGELTKISFWHLFENHLKPNGLYVIEDWGTGYWDDWVDGKSFDLNSYFAQPAALSLFWSRIKKKLKIKSPLNSHRHGMVGFIKQLVDEQAAYDATRKKQTEKPIRSSKFKKIMLTPFIVFIEKSS